MSLSTLEKMLEPHSVAIVGASREPGKLGNILVANIQKSRFAGKIFPINPNAKKINRLDAYPSYSKLPEAPDLAIVAIPADAALEVLPEIARKGTRNVVILSAGFKEIGAEGIVREQRLADAARKYKLQVIGPNCLGFINNDCNLNATFGQADHTDGTVRFISQSGAIATSIFDWARTTGIGFSSFITLGNKTIANENDVLQYYIHKDSLGQHRDIPDGASHYQPIGLYLESITDGRKFLSLAGTLSKKDPIFIIKPGKSTAAQAAMKSHTGALANDDAVLSAALREAGILRADGLEDFFDLARAFAWESAPRGPRVAIVSNAGGPGVLTTDAVEAAGLSLATISQSTAALLAQNLPRAANLHNPIDVLGDALADRYATAMSAVLAEKEVDALIVLLTPQIMTQIKETAQNIVAMSHKYKKPILCSFMGGEAIEVGEKVLEKHRIPSFRFPERAVKALGAMWQWQKNKNANKVFDTVAKKISTPRALMVLMNKARHAKYSALPSADAQALLRTAGVRTPPEVVVSSKADAVQAAIDFKYPVVLKVSSAKALHKTELHAVRVGLADAKSVIDAYEDLNKIKSKLRDPEAEILLQKQIVGAVEIIAGIKRDPSFGTVLMFGAGGVLAELVRDTHIALAPLTDNEITTLIGESSIGRVLRGYRGAQPYAVSKLVQLIQILCKVAAAYPQIQEIEINPVLVTHRDVYAVDTKIVQHI